MMQPFRSETGLLASIPTSNVDTDVIMPKQFLRGIDRKGLARGVFHELRADPAQHPDFALNHPDLKGAIFLVVGPNFGCGSSREHAVWGLMQYGIRAIIGTSFGGIFSDNAANNGLLLLSCPEDRVERLHRAATDSLPCIMTLDLERQVIALESGEMPFEIDAGRKAAILSGQDQIARTESLLHGFDGFETLYQQERPWLRLA